MHISDEFVLVKVYGGLQNSDLWPNGGAGGDAPFHLLTPLSDCGLFLGGSSVFQVL